MNNCEQNETHISAWLDAELDRAEQVELLDHLARCEACRGFYLEARSLDGMVATLGPGSIGSDMTFRTIP